MPESPYDWTGKRTEKRDRQKRMLVVTAITMGALILVLGMVDGLLILLDQLPRNAFRDTAHMFATDPLALMFARAAIARGDDRKVAHDLRPFVLMPLMHSESLADQETLLTLLDEVDQPNTYRFAVIHRDIIARFGRFPHRNACLGRETTADEAAFLAGDGFKG